MSGINKVILIGNLGNDPEHKKFDNGGSLTNISIATSERWTDKQTGEPRELTEWHRIVFSNRLAEIAAQYLRKGSKVYVEGSLRTRKWQDQNGQDRYTTEIRANQMQMLDSRGDSNMGGGNMNNMGGGMNNGMNNNMGGQGYQQPAQQPQQQYQQPAQAPQQPQGGAFSANPAATPIADDDLPF